MITYEKTGNREKTVISLTGLTPSEFGMLLPFFGRADDILTSRKIEETERGRVCGGGRKSVFGSSSDKLLFILFYFKLYPLRILIGFLSGTGRAGRITGFTALRMFRG